VITDTATVERYLAMIDEVRPSLPGQHLDWLQLQRRHAAGEISRRGFPTRRDEGWRYSGVERLLKQQFMPLAEAPPLSGAEIRELTMPHGESHRVVVVNGRIDKDLSHTDGLPQGVWMENLREAILSEPDRVSDWLGRAMGEPAHAFNALNTALISDGLLIHVENGTSLDRPIEVLHVSAATERAGVIHPRNLVVLEAGARVTLLERYAGSRQSHYFRNGVTEVLLAPGAALDHQRLQDEPAEAFHLSSVFVQQAGGSRYRGTAIALGAAWSRTDYHVDFGAEGAECHLEGLYLVGARQLCDFHVDVRHGVPGCTSRENFKGILYGRGRAVFDGRIVVEAGAQKSDAHLSNRNLLLTRDAEVDTKPRLEIFADDVKCSHGTTVGQLDPDHVFYLRSRGIDEDHARRMLCLGFAGEILDGCGVESWRQRVGAALQSGLNSLQGEAA
jgi:Fe-S cluster assembly protein SufD